MSEVYVHHRITTEPRAWRSVAESLQANAARQIGEVGGKLYGIWRSQIGRPRDEVTLITVWPEGTPAVQTDDSLLAGIGSIRSCESAGMVPTLRPLDPTPPQRQGNYAFRWFETPAENWQKFQDLSAAAWPDFEASYDSQVIGLWRFLGGDGTMWRSLLLTRRPSLSMWERSKIPEGEVEMEVRRKLSERFDLSDWTCVYTMTLLTAEDADDTVRWT